MASEYWDSCLFLAYLQDQPEERELVDVLSALLRRAESGETLIVVSTFVLAEIQALRPHEPNHADVIWNLFHTNRPYLKMVALSPRIAELAGTVGGAHRITPPTRFMLQPPCLREWMSCSLKTAPVPVQDAEDSLPSTGKSGHLP